MEVTIAFDDDEDLDGMIYLVSVSCYDRRAEVFLILNLVSVDEGLEELEAFFLVSARLLSHL